MSTRDTGGQDRTTRRTDEPDEGESANPGWSRPSAEVTPDTHREKQRQPSHEKRTHQ